MHILYACFICKNYIWASFITIENVLLCDYTHMPTELWLDFLFYIIALVARSPRCLALYGFKRVWPYMAILMMRYITCAAIVEKFGVDSWKNGSTAPLNTRRWHGI